MDNLQIFVMFLIRSSIAIFLMAMAFMLFDKDFWELLIDNFKQLPLVGKIIYVACIPFIIGVAILLGTLAFTGIIL